MGLDIDFITVALATYRRPKEMKCALDALASQEFTRLRVLIADDAPCEENQVLVQGVAGLNTVYMPRFTRLGVLHNHLSMIPQISSDFFMFHGDDDEMLPDGLCQLSEPLKASQDYDAVFSNYRVGPIRLESHPVALNKLPFVRYWRHPDWRIRMLAFYLCPAFLGKQNLFYGLFRTKAVRNIDLEKAIPPRQHHLNMDEMFAFQAVCNGPVLVIDHECYFFAQDNHKHYIDVPKQRKGWLQAFIGFIRYEWITLFDYLRNTRGRMAQAVLIGMFPLKVLVALAWRYAPWLK